MWYRFASQYSIPPPYMPDESHQLGPNASERLTVENEDADTDVGYLSAWDKKKKALENPHENPYEETLEGQLADLHQETKNVTDPSSTQPDKYWRGQKQPSGEETPDGWPSSLSRVQV